MLDEEYFQNNFRSINQCGSTKSPPSSYSLHHFCNAKPQERPFFDPVHKNWVCPDYPKGDSNPSPEIIDQAPDPMEDIDPIPDDVVLIERAPDINKRQSVWQQVMNNYVIIQFRCFSD